MFRPALSTNAISIPIAAVIAIALTACSGESEDKSYRVGVEDVGGGELQVADPQPGDVEVDLPETPMKNVPGNSIEEAQGNPQDPPQL